MNSNKRRKKEAQQQHLAEASLALRSSASATADTPLSPLLLSSNTATTFAPSSALQISTTSSTRTNANLGAPTSADSEDLGRVVIGATASVAPVAPITPTATESILYARLPTTLLPSNAAVLRRKQHKTFVQNYTASLIDPASNAKAQRTFRERLSGKSLSLDNPISEEFLRKKAARKTLMLQNKKKHHHPKTREVQRRVLKASEPMDPSYHMYRPLHLLWRQYIQQLLASQLHNMRFEATAQNIHLESPLSPLFPLLTKADMHGALLEVKQCRAPSLLFLKGIVLHETEQTFRVVTKQNEIKVLPKINTVFLLQFNDEEDTDAQQATPLPPLEILIYGNHFRYRNYERATRKFKGKPTIEF